jgi:soluble lytic murein transglycosylase
LLLRGQAYKQAGDSQQAISTWETVLKQFADQPEAADALFALGETQPQRQEEFWNQVIAKFPSHPRAVEIAQARLRSRPNDAEMLLLIARNGLYVPEIKTVLNRLSSEFADKLTPADWEAIGFGHWEKLEYEKAARAYARASKIALNRFRVARGLQLGSKRQEAISAYQQFVQEFPKASETPIAYLRLARLSEIPPQTLKYLDQSIQAAIPQKLRDRIAEALADKIAIFDKDGNGTAAATARKELFGNYSDTEAAAAQRWLQAQQFAKQSQWEAARQKALDLAKANPNSLLAPRALFWAGQWAAKQRNNSAQQEMFTQLWQRYPESFYTWRAASLSKWEVGTFTTVQSFQPDIMTDQVARLTLPAGSEATKELYRVGLNQFAWERWQWEFKNRVKPTPDEQLTDGLLRLGIGEYLDGIFMLENLRQRAQQEPDFQERFTQLQRQPGYWYALYPLPYLKPVEKWSAPYDLNPLLVMALMRQESRFQPQIRSVAGAVGLMQIMPETGVWIGDQTGEKKYSLDNPDDNIKFGTWYLDHTHDLYQGNSLYALASYNAGPGNLDDWLKRFNNEDPDTFIESIPFDETQNYVKRVMENYWNYLRLYNPDTIAHLKQYQSALPGQ